MAGGSVYAGGYAYVGAAAAAAGYWKDGETLFGHSVEATRGNWVALTGYGAVLADRDAAVPRLGGIAIVLGFYPQAILSYINGTLHLLVQNIRPL